MQLEIFLCPWRLQFRYCIIFYKNLIVFAGTYDRLCAFVQSVLDAVESGDDALAAGDFSLLDGNVEVNAENRKKNNASKIFSVE